MTETGEQTRQTVSAFNRRGFEVPTTRLEADDHGSITLTVHNDAN
jgi:hypothetical protein